MTGNHSSNTSPRRHSVNWGLFLLTCVLVAVFIAMVATALLYLMLQLVLQFLSLAFLPML